MQKSISIIIPNYNGRHLLEENIPPLYEALKTSEIDDFEVIVSDDNSSDDSCAFLEKNYPKINLIKGDTNLGFSGNMNRGIFKAKKELVLLLNSDVTLKEGYFTPCLSYFEDPDTFGVMGAILSSNNEIQDSAKFPEVVRLKIKGTINYRFLDNIDIKTPTFFLSGANALIRRELLVKINGFNEIYNPYYAEDVDLSLRAWRYGYNCYFEKKAECIHPISGTISKEKKGKVNLIRRRNRFIIHYLHLGNTQLAFWLISHWVKYLGKLLLLDFNYTKSFNQFLKKKKELKKQRKSLNQESRINLNEVRTKVLSMIGERNIQKF